MIAKCEKCHCEHRLKIDGIKANAVKYKCISCGHMNKAVINRGTEQPNRLSARSAAADAFKNGGKGKSDASGKLIIPGYSIKTKLTLFVIAILFISLTIFSSIVSLKGEKVITSQAQNFILLITSQKVKEYNSIFSRIQDEIAGIAEFAASTTTRNNFAEDLGTAVLMPWNGTQYGTSQMRELYRVEVLALQRIGLTLKGFVKNNPYVELGYMATNNNIMVFNDEKVVSVVEQEKGYIPTIRPWYKEAMKRKKTIWTQPYVDVNTKKLIVSCATPVANASKTIQGVIGFDVLLDTIQQDIISLDIGYDSQAFLLNENGKFLVKPGMQKSDSAWHKAVTADSALDTDNVKFKKIVTDMMAEKSGMGTYVDQGRNLLVSHAPIYAIDASVGIVISEEELMKSAADIRKLIIGVWVVLLVISGFMCRAIGSSITNPINELSYQADLISQGKSDLAEIKTKRKDEIGLLIDSYNRLIASLKIAIYRRRK
jgi:two-component system sensor histidine kinase/response regulator